MSVSHLYAEQHCPDLQSRGPLVLNKGKRGKEGEGERLVVVMKIMQNNESHKNQENNETDDNQE